MCFIVTTRHFFHFYLWKKSTFFSRSAWLTRTHQKVFCAGLMFSLFFICSELYWSAVAFSVQFLWFLQFTNVQYAHVFANVWVRWCFIVARRKFNLKNLSAHKSHKCDPKRTRNVQKLIAKHLTLPTLLLKESTKRALNNRETHRVEWWITDFSVWLVLCAIFDYDSINYYRLFDCSLAHFSSAAQINYVEQ